MTSSDRSAGAAAARAVWSAGDYHRFATDLVWGLGADLVAAAGVERGQRVLDVAAGSGNAALRAAVAGARVVASDITPENMTPGEAEAERRGLSIEWVEADAQQLPFDDASFDVVLSSVGAMWAPDHRAVADEMVRVCRPGGTIAMVNFAADGLISGFLDVFGPYAPPPPPGASSPTLWGSRDHVRELLADSVASLDLTSGSYVERVPGGPRGYCEYYKETFGPVVSIYAALAHRPHRVAALDEDFLAFATRANQGPPGGPAELAFTLLRIVARTRS